MKRLKLSLNRIEGTEILTREQLKSILGGEDGSGSEAGAICIQCASDANCRETQECRESTSCPNKGKVCAKRHWA